MLARLFGTSPTSRPRFFFVFLKWPKLPACPVTLSTPVNLEMLASLMLFCHSDEFLTNLTR